MTTITAVTSDQAEFFRVLNWTYDQGDLAAILHTAIAGGTFQLKVALSDSDSRLPALSQELGCQEKWTVCMSPSEPL